MRRFRLTPRARNDLRDLWDYIALDSLSAADRVVEDIYSAMRLLAEFPGMGHRRDDLADETLRVWPVRSQLVVYRPDRRPIQIVRIVGGYQDLIPLLIADD